MKTYLTTILLTLSLACSFAKNAPALKNSKSNILFHEIFFNTDSHVINNMEFNKLLDFIKTIETVDIDKISVYGYCDDRGSLNYNLKLSNKRANAIKTIIAKYVATNNASKVDIAGKGELELLTQKENLFSQLRTLNRKVIVRVLPRKQIANAFFNTELKTGKTFNLPTIKFIKGVRYITKESHKDLNNLADFLLENKGIFFTIQGHVCCTRVGADSRDKETGKRNLSLVRAKFIQDYLVKRGIDASRIKHQGLKGAYNLGGDDKDDRRVELLITAIK